MIQKYKKGTEVFNWFFDIETAELKYQKLIVQQWFYMDGMQWEIIDTYKLLKKTTVPYFKFFKKTLKEQVRLPGYLISQNKLYAKTLLIHEMMEAFGYLLKDGYRNFCSENTYKTIVKAQQEYINLNNNHPELIVKVLGEFKPDNTSPGWMWR
jgi:thioredoxin-related protein